MAEAERPKSSAPAAQEDVVPFYSMEDILDAYDDPSFNYGGQAQESEDREPQVREPDRRKSVEATEIFSVPRDTTPLSDATRENPRVNVSDATRENPRVDALGETRPIRKNPERMRSEVLGDVVEPPSVTAESFDFSDPQAVDQFAAEVSRSIAGKDSQEPETPVQHGSIFRSRWRQAEREPVPALPPEPEPPEPELHSQIPRFSYGAQSLQYRSLAAMLLCVLMLAATFLAEAGRSLPFGIGSSTALASGALALCQLIVLLLCVEVPIHGITDILRLKPGAESLTTVASACALLHAIIVLKSGGADSGLPYCAVTSFAVVFSLRGWLFYRIGIRSALKGASEDSAVCGVISEFHGAEDKSVLRKVKGRVTGFYRNLVSQDICEQLYTALTPLFFACAVVFALLAAAISGHIGEYWRCLAAMLAISASFSTGYAYNLPFRRVTRGAKASGAIVAGWGGASEIFDSDSVIVTDTDLFPTGTAKLNGYRVFDGFEHTKGVAHTASLLVASGSGLAPVFRELLKSENLPLESVESFDCYEGGGVGAVVQGDKVFTGSAAFMSLQGIRIPERVNLKNGVFTVINGRLAAVFAINYEPVYQIQGALFTLLRTRIGMAFAVRDFNLTPAMLQQRYKISGEGIRFLSASDCYRLTSDEVPENCRTNAVLTREGLSAMSEAVLRGRHLKIISELASILTALGSVIGFLLMFVLMLGGAYESACAGNMLLYMLVIHALVLVVAVLPQRPR